MSANEIYCCTVVELYENLYANFSVQKRTTVDLGCPYTVYVALVVYIFHSSVI